MHYYKRNLGDYAKKAGRLSMLQHGSYTLLIDACYDRERFPTLEEAIEWTWASSTAEIEAVEFVLRKFFDLEDGVYVQKRIQEEIAEYRAKSETNTRIAKERETKRAAGITKRSTVVNGASPDKHDSPPNQEPLTKNHKPATPQPPKGGCRRFEEFWTAWPKGERKQDKVKCAEKWRRGNLDDLADKILADIEVKRHTEKWREGYIEAPLVYLNGRRWEDGVTPEAKAGTPAADPESRVSVEAEGERLGVGRWDENREQWHVYRGRVRDAQEGITA